MYYTIMSEFCKITMRASLSPGLWMGCYPRASSPHILGFLTRFYFLGSPLKSRGSRHFYGLSGSYGPRRRIVGRFRLDMVRLSTLGDMCLIQIRRGLQCRHALQPCPSGIGPLKPIPHSRKEETPPGGGFHDEDGLRRVTYTMKSVSTYYTTMPNSCKAQATGECSLRSIPSPEVADRMMLRTDE